MLLSSTCALPGQAGTVHFWLAAPVQVQICNRVPFALELPVASTHLSDPDPTMSRAAVAAHFWFAVPPQSQSCSWAPSAVDCPVTSRHLPSARIVPSVPRVHCWAL